MRFEVRAYHPVTGVVGLDVEARDSEDARRQTERQGMRVFVVRRAWHERFKWTAKDRFDLLLFSQELQSLLVAGLSIVEALNAIGRKEMPSAKRRLVEDLTRNIQEGLSFGSALRQHPQFFPPLFLALVAASEQTGQLADTLGRFIAYRIQMDGLRKRIQSAAIYPLLLLAVGGLVILFLMGYVVPRFARIYEDFGRDLPFMSRLLLQWGQLVTHHGDELMLVLVTATVAGVIAFRNRRIDWKSLLAIGPVRERMVVYELSRFYRTLGILQQGGIPLVNALAMARELLAEATRTRIDESIVAIRSGATFSVAMEGAGLAPPVALDLLRVGEKSGDLGEKMIRIANFFDEESSRWIEWFSKLFEPILMLLIGLLIALIVVLLYLPIFELAGSLQ